MEKCLYSAQGVLLCGDKATTKSPESPKSPKSPKKFSLPGAEPFWQRDMMSVIQDMNSGSSAKKQQASDMNELFMGMLPGDSLTGQGPAGKAGTEAFCNGTCGLGMH